MSGFLTTENTEGTEGATPETDADNDTQFELAAWELLKEARRERDEARGLARHLYWAGCDLRRFATAYAQNYDETDGKEGAFQAIADFHEAMKGMARILGEEAAK